MLRMTLLVTFLIIAAGPALVNATIVDTFDGIALDPAWGPVKTDPTGFALPGTISANNNAVSGGTWNISSMTINANATIGNVYVTRNVASMTGGDFVVEMDFKATSLTATDYGYVTASLLDATGNLVVGGGWQDDIFTQTFTIANLGDPVGKVLNGGNTVISTPRPYGGEAEDAYGRLVMRRIAGVKFIDFGFIDEANFTDYLSIPLTTLAVGPGLNNNAVESLELRFSYIRLDSFPATFTPFAIDRVSVVPAPVPGDANGNGQVTIDDYLLIRANNFTTVRYGQNGDLNLDGFVDYDDFQEWKQFYPGGAAAADAAIKALNVPEPTSIALCSLAGLVLLVALRGKLDRSSNTSFGKSTIA